MAKLPKSIIKKHGITKKAWRIFKSRGRGKAKTISTRTKTQVKKVAKRKGKKAAPRTFTQKLMGRIGTPLAAMAYGFTRDKISDAIAMSAIGQRLPVTQFTDELAMIGLAFGARKLGLAKNPIGGKLIRAAETIEWARIGEELSNTQQSGKGLFNIGRADNSAMAQAELL